MWMTDNTTVSGGGRSTRGGDALRVLIADDHRLLAEAMADLLKSEAGFDSDTVGSYEEVIRALGAEQGYDIVLLDLKMPGMIGLDSVRNIVQAAGSGKVVLFTAQVDRHFLNSALSLGAKGLITKTMALQSLVSVIRLINSGQVFVPMQELIQSGGAADDEGERSLSEKELFVLRLAADGLTNKEIARDLGSTEVMVKMHMRSACKKLGVRNRAHAAMISRERSLF